MSNETNETIEDIIHEMRGPYYKMGRSNASLDKDMMGYMSFMANRLEAAWKREREAGADAAQICGKIGEMIGREASCKQSVTNCNRFCNAAKMREALKRADAALIQISKSDLFIDANFAVTKAVIDSGNAIEAALSAPPRNCDVGTADEQAERFAEYCDSEACKRNRCKSRAKALCIERCAIAWSQMPYEKGDAK